MHIIHDEIGIPKVTMSGGTGGDDNTATFTIAPLPNGFGHTLGNALRRVLLSSVPGAAITAVRIDGANHEYMTIEGVTDTALDICLNLKQVDLRKHSAGAETATLAMKGEGDLKAGEIKASSDVEIINGDHVVTTLDKKAKSISMEVKIEKGVGYLPAKQQQKTVAKKDGEGWIYIDATFSPVERVQYEVSATRVGDNTDLDKLEMTIITNGSISAEDAMKFSSQVLQQYFELFQKDQSEMVESEFMASMDAGGSAAAGDDEWGGSDVQESYTPIEVLNLSPRTLNALINGNIGSIEELVECSMAKLENLRGFGKKAMDEVAEALEGRGLALQNN